MVECVRHTDHHFPNPRHQTLNVPCLWNSSTNSGTLPASSLFSISYWYSSLSLLTRSLSAAAERCNKNAHRRWQPAGGRTLGRETRRRRREEALRGAHGRGGAQGGRRRHADRARRSLGHAAGGGERKARDGAERGHCDGRCGCERERRDESRATPRLFTPMSRAQGGDALPDRVAQCVLDAYRRHVAPLAPLQDGEWTIVAGIAVSDADGDDVRCVAIGIGLKCLASVYILDSGEAVVDSHAEILAGRAFRTWLCTSAEAALPGKAPAPDNGKSMKWINQNVDGSTRARIRIDPSLRFHLYTSEVPCGDASMESLDRNQTDEARQLNESKRKEYDTGRLNDESAGESSEQGPVIRGRLDYSKVGILRTKPGRPDAPPSFSMSCSDKIARWNVVGVAGKRLTDLLEAPIYLSTIIVGSSYDHSALQRALFERLLVLDNTGESSLPGSFCVNRPRISRTSIAFEYDRSPSRSQTCHLSACWWEGAKRAEVLTDGRIHGTPKPKDGRLKPKAISSVSRAAQQKALDHLSERVQTLGWVLPNSDSSDYTAADRLLKTTAFRGWVGNDWKRRTTL